MKIGDIVKLNNAKVMARISNIEGDNIYIVFLFSTIKGLGTIVRRRQIDFILSTELEKIIYGFAD